MKIKMFPANSGDSFLVSCGENHIFIDGGYRDTYTDFIRAELENINKMNQKIDLAIITHIDQDHIQGILEFIKDNGEHSNSNIIDVKEIWHNSYKHLQFEYADESENIDRECEILKEQILKGNIIFKEGERKISAYEGSTLASILFEKNYNWNNKFKSQAVLCKDYEKIEISDDTNIILLSPIRDSLNKLKNIWKKSLNGRKRGFKFKEEKYYNDAFEFFLYNLKEQDKAMPKKISNNNAEENTFEFGGIDGSLTNESSIAFILENQEKKALFLGDANPVIIYNSLIQLKKIYPEYSFSFDAIKVSHHGSLGNMTEELLDLIDSEVWLFSGNGHNNNPDKKLIDIIIEKKKSYMKKLIFNYDSFEWLNEIRGKQKCNNYLVISGNGECIIEIALEEKNDIRFKSINKKYSSYRMWP